MKDRTDRRGTERLEEGCRRGYRGRRRLRSLREIVSDYKERFRPRAMRELRFFAGLRGFDKALTEAGLAKMPNGKRWSHQRRIPQAALQEATRCLRRGGVEAARSFDELLRWVESAARPVRGVGELYVYDTALRIGAHLGLLPRHVYLHAGARVGARALGLDHGVRAVDLRQLPAPLAKLRPYEIEDVLCIYKDWLAAARG